MSTTTASSFASLLRQFRLRINKSQQELSDDLKSSGVKLYSSDISKLERGERKPPSDDYMLTLIKILQLTHEEIQTFLEAGNYAPSVLNSALEEMKKQRASTTATPIYPPNTEEQGLKYLLSNFPSWQCKENGILIAFNRSVMWLFMTTLISDLMGKHIFEVFSRPWNFTRIAITGELNDFPIIKLQILKWLEKHYPSKELEEAKRIILAKPAWKILYENLDKMNLEGITFYEYTLHIQHPEIQNHYLHFLVKISVIKKPNGDVEKFIVVYEPNDPYTSDVIVKKSQELLVDKETPYIYRSTPFSPDDPTLTYNKLWYITSENDAHKQLTKKLSEEWGVAPVSAKGKHLIELLYEEPFKYAMGAVGLWEDTITRLIKAFKACMQRHLMEEPELQKDYDAVIASLSSQLKGFSEWFKASPPLQSLPSNYSVPQKVCDIIEKLSPRQSTQLSFESYVLFPQPGIPEYIQTLVPKDEITRTAFEQIRANASLQSITS